MVYFGGINSDEWRVFAGCIAATRLLRTFGKCAVLTIRIWELGRTIFLQCGRTICLWDIGAPSMPIRDAIWSRQACPLTETHIIHCQPTGYKLDADNTLLPSLRGDREGMTCDKRKWPNTSLSLFYKVRSALILRFYSKQGGMKSPIFNMLSWPPQGV